MKMGTSSWSEHTYLPFWLFVFPSWLKFLSSEKKIIWFRLDGFLVVPKGLTKLQELHTLLQFSGPN